MKIEIGNYKLIHSGVVIQIGDNPIRMTLPDEIEGDFTFIAIFTINENDKKSVTKLTAIDQFTLEINFINFNRFVGGGNTELIMLGTLRHKKLYLNYRIFDLDNVGKTLMYNFYVSEEV